jgi:D-glycero-alpha-D-manno-heptose-7-phosphate kinase
MIISRTPFRISFFGGGSDYPAWYEKNGGAVLSTTINKYCYITVRHLPPFFDYNFRIRYFHREETKKISEIIHPSVREVLKYLKIKNGLDLVHHADLPAMSGLGSSSTFTVGLLHAVHALKNQFVTKRQLALEAIKIEQDINKENVGSQDQTAASFGGLNKINFGGKNKIQVEPIFLSSVREEEFQSHLLLFFTGFARIASVISKEQIDLISQKKINLYDVHNSVEEGIKIICSNEPIKNLGKLLDEQWKIKRSLTSKITNDEIDSIYSIGIKAGALGGKILGAGGGGFMLFFVPPEKHGSVKKALKKLLHVPFKFESLGSQIVYFSNEIP